MKDEDYKDQAIYFNDEDSLHPIKYKKGIDADNMRTIKNAHNRYKEYRA